VRARKARRQPKKTTEPVPLPLAERLQRQRERLFNAISIVACCRFACSSRCTDIHPEDMAGALEAAYDIVDEVAGQLGVICDEHAV
jgi:hypothetical protein